MPSRLLHVIRSMNPAHGGPVEVVRQFSRVHREMGCQVEIATLDAPGEPWLADAPAPIHALGVEGAASGRGYGFSPKFVPWLKEHHREFDAVISHGLWQYNNAGTREALLESGTPYYVFPHGMLDPWFKRAYPVKHLKKAVYWLLREHRVLRDAAAVLFTCEEERRLGRETFRPWNCTERVVTLGIAPPPMADAERQREVFFEKFPALRGKEILLFLGRLHDKKGCDLLLEAFGAATPRPGVVAHLLMAGPCADGEYERKLKTLAERHTPAGAVSFPGMLAGDLKWGALHAAAAFVLPSHQENFGIAVAEALACGLPVLISNKVNIWREIADDQAGLVEADSLEGTRALLERWAQMDAGKRAAMRAAAAACFARRFHIQKSAHDLLELLVPSGEKGETSDAAASSA